jgi:hypothetical protein
MTAHQFTESAPQRNTPPRHSLSRLEAAVQAAIRRGLVVGSEVLIGKIPGIVVGYNISGYGRFVGATYPVVVRTALGVAKCRSDELELV